MATMLIRIFIIILFLLDVILHGMGKFSDAKAAYEIACDIFLWLLWSTKDD